MMKVGVSSYSFTQAYNDGRITLKQAIGKAKEMGFDAFEIVDFNMFSCRPEGMSIEEYFEGPILDHARELREEIDRVGIHITNFTCGADFQNRDIEKEVARLCRCVDVAEILGATGLRHDVASGPKHHMAASSKVLEVGKQVPQQEYVPVAFESFYKVLPRIADGIRKVTEYAASKGIRTMSENHGFFAQDVLRVEKLMDEVNHPNYGWLVDMGNFTCADEKPQLSCSIAAPYAVYVHAKDFIIKPASGPNPGRFFFKSRAGNYLRGTIVGQGDVDVKGCLAALKNGGYDGYVSIEFEGMEDCFLACEAGLENLRRYIAELEA